MAEHAELVAELPLVEKMTTAERLKHAKKRRSTQLKKYSHYEKQVDKENKKRKTQGSKKMTTSAAKKPKTTRVHFVHNIMLLEAAARNDIDEVDKLLGGGVSPDVTNEDGLTALHQCCIDDQETLLKILLKYSANVNAKDSELWTPLHAAATCGHVHLCRLLVDNGAELLAVNADGNMPYDICEDDITLDYIESEMAKRGVTQELIDETRLSSERKMLEDMISLAEHGGDLTFRGRAGETPLHIAAANGYLQVAEFLLDQRVPIDITDDDTWQPIHAAACWGHLHILELLVQHGADLEARTKSNETPLEICEDPEIRQRIMEMRDEIQSNQSTKSRDLHRRRSQNSRSGHGVALYSSNSSLADKASASIRRTSMREKTPMALKEAKEEALRLRNSAASTDDEEEDDSRNGVATATERPHSRHLSDMAEEDEASSPVAVGSIHLEETKPDHNTDSTSAKHALPPSATTVPPVVTNGNHSPEKQQRNSSEPADYDVKVTTAITPRPKQTDNTSASNHGITVNSNTNSTSQTDKLSTPAERNRAASSASTGSATSGKTASSRDSQPSTDGSTLSPPVPRGDVSPGAVRGTLADLKKHRALKQHGKDSSSQSSQIDEYSHSHSDSENNIIVSPPSTHSNGQDSMNSMNSMNSTPGRNGLHKNENMYYVAGDQPKHKFTASKSEIIGGNDTKTSCCTIL